MTAHQSLWYPLSQQRGPVSAVVGGSLRLPVDERFDGLSAPCPSGSDGHVLTPPLHGMLSLSGRLPAATSWLHLGSMVVIVISITLCVRRPNFQAQVEERLAKALGVDSSGSCTWGGHVL
jgi:hypothetical protein